MNIMRLDVREVVGRMARSGVWRHDLPASRVQPPQRAWKQQHEASGGIVLVDELALAPTPR